MAIAKAETTRKPGGFTKHVCSSGASSRLFANKTPFTNQLAFVIVHRAPGRSKAAAAVQSMGALVLMLMRPQKHVVTTASFGLINHGIDQHPSSVRSVLTMCSICLICDSSGLPAVLAGFLLLLRQGIVCGRRCPCPTRCVSGPIIRVLILATQVL